MILINLFNREREDLTIYFAHDKFKDDKKYQNMAEKLDDLRHEEHH